MINFRIAITPSGILHIGNFFIICINYFLKNKIISNIILRFDNTNKKKIKNKNKIFIIKTLKKNGFFFKNIINQTDYINYYNNIYFKKQKIIFKKNFFNKKILKKNLCYSEFMNIKYCFLNFLDNNFGLFKNKIFYKKIILVKNNGIYTYNFSSIFDDKFFNILFIIRGKEWINQIPIQLVIKKYYDYNFVYNHLPNINNFNNKKISKRYNKNKNLINYINVKKINNIFNIKNKKDIKFCLVKNKQKKLKKINYYLFYFLYNNNFFFKKKYFLKKEYIFSNYNFIKKNFKDIKNMMFFKKKKKVIIKIKKYEFI